jgi:arabinofuranan 3-O-arabinosyltransferase
LEGTIAELLAGDPVAYRSCEAVRLGQGWHHVDAGDNAAVDRLELRSVDVGTPRPPPASPVSWQVTQESPTLFRVQADSPEGAVVILQQSYAPGWTATVNGRRLGPASPLDTLNGWTVDERGRLDIELRFAGQRYLNLALLVTVVGLVACGVLIGRSRPQEPPRRRAEGRS